MKTIKELAHDFIIRDSGEPGMTGRFACFLDSKYELKPKDWQREAFGHLVEKKCPTGYSKDSHVVNLCDCQPEVEKKCICLEDNKLTQALCEIHKPRECEHGHLWSTHENSNICTMCGKLVPLEPTPEEAIPELPDELDILHELSEAKDKLAMAADIYRISLVVNKLIRYVALRDANKKNHG